MLSAALLSAATLLPAHAHATTSFPDPTDAGASVPAITVPSAFDGYQSIRQGNTSSWQELNRATATDPGMGGMGGMDHSHMDDGMPKDDHGTGHAGEGQ